MSKAIHVKDLPELTGIQGPSPLLYCSKCGEELSANRGDYFMAAPDTKLTHCGKNLWLVTKSTILHQEA